MTYTELLEKTASRKQAAITKINTAINGPAGWLCKAEAERDPGMLAWVWLAKDFCEELAEHVDEFLEQCDDIDSYEAKEIGDIYVAYENGDSDLYDLLPWEARLFDE